MLSIIDDNFPVNTAKGQQILSLLRDAGKRFLCQVSPETALDQKSLKDLARSGCILVGVGMESINPQSLAFLGKPLQKDPSRSCGANTGCRHGVLPQSGFWERW